MLYTNNIYKVTRLKYGVQFLEKRIIGPIFRDWALNSANYQDVMHELVVLLEEDERACWFQQDGVTCHSSYEITDLLERFILDRLIGKGLYPPRSPDINPQAVYFL